MKGMNRHEKQQVRLQISSCSNLKIDCMNIIWLLLLMIGLFIVSQLVFRPREEKKKVSRQKKKNQERYVESEKKNIYILKLLFQYKRRLT